jgi:hypothetical protein
LQIQPVTAVLHDLRKVWKVNSALSRLDLG